MDNEEIKEESLFSEDMFHEEEELLSQELSDLNDLYTELKDHFDKIKNSGSRGSLTFIEKQTSNLVSLRSAKLNVLKEKIGIKKNLADLKYKEQQLAKNNGESSLNGISEAIYNRIAKDFIYNKDDNTLVNKVEPSNETNVDEELDSMFDEEMLKQVDSVVGVDVIESDESIDEDSIEENNESIETEDDGTIIIVDPEGNNFYKINEETYEIIEELGHVEKIIEFVNDDEDQEQVFGIGASEAIYPVLEIEE